MRAQPLCCNAARLTGWAVFLGLTESFDRAISLDW